MSCSNDKAPITTCDGGLGAFKKSFSLNPKDWIYENEMPVRIKRKYGKYDRKNAIIYL